MSAPAHYKQGPQGNLVADYAADFAARYGGTVPKIEGPLGTPGIEDRRDNRDPMDVYRELHPHEHTISTNGASATLTP